MSKTDAEFIKAVCTNLDIRESRTAKRWIEGIVEVIFRELHYEGYCKVPLLGIFTTNEVSERSQMRIVDGELKSIYTPKHYIAKFNPSDDCVKAINDEYVSRRTRKVKAEELTEEEYLKFIRQQARKEFKEADPMDKYEAMDEMDKLIMGIKNNAKKKRKEKDSDE